MAASVPLEGPTATVHPHSGWVRQVRLRGENSRTSTHRLPGHVLGLFVAQGFDGVETGSAEGGVDPEEEADRR